MNIICILPLIKLGKLVKVTVLLMTNTVTDVPFILTVKLFYIVSYVGNII